MYRYKMKSGGSGRFGLVVFFLLIGLLLLYLSGVLGGGGGGTISAQQSPSPSVSSQADASTLARLWTGVKVTAARLWGQVSNLGAKPVDVDLGGSVNGAGDDEPDPESLQDIVVQPEKQVEPTSFVPAGATPQILIYHTHTHEAYTKTDGENYTEAGQWRTTNNEYNVVRVGEELARQLSSRYGIAVLHDTTDNEYPQLGTAYTRSLSMLQKDLEKNKELKILIDLHRDAYNTGIDPNVATINGVKAARVMMVIGTGEGQTGAGFKVRPDWQKNLSLANGIMDRLGQFDANLARKTSIKTGRYNQHVSTGAILIEVGNNKNTLDEALATVPFLAQAIAEAYENLSVQTAAQPSVSPTGTPAVSPSPSSSALSAMNATSIPSTTATQTTPAVEEDEPVEITLEPAESALASPSAEAPTATQAVP